MSPPVTIVIDTAYGVLVREVPAASPLPPDSLGGHASEAATRDAAAIWGLPDFLYRAVVYRKGSSSREFGDNLLIVGDLGLVVQVKRREQPSADATREQAWLAKHSTIALNQARGTIRALSSKSLRLTNARGRSIDVDGSQIRWVAVAVLDHPNPPLGIVPVTEDSPVPSIVLLRRDWEFLFNQLKSSHAVGQYIERVVGESWEIGAEPSRYFQLANADAHAQPGPVGDLLGSGGRVRGGPQLPLEPAATGLDELPHLLLRSLLEDIATGPIDGLDEENRLHVLAQLDRLGVAQRAGIGTYLLGAMEAAASAPAGEVWWRHRQFAGADEKRPLHLGYATCSHEWDDVIRGMFTTWVSLRHHELGERLGRHDNLTTVGLAVTPRNDRRRPWDTSMVAAVGDLRLEPEVVAQYQQIWNRPDDG
jgi:hypothetical protein